MTEMTLQTAKYAAIAEVERLLQRSDDLKRLPNLLTHHATKGQVARTQLAATLSSQIDAIRSGLEVLSGSQRTLSMMRNCYTVIDFLCTECANLIEHHEKIQILSAVHYNLGKTLQDVENIVALPLEASAAESMLKHDIQLLQAYETLSILEGTAMMAQQKMSSSTLKHEDTHNLDFYFDKVKQTMVKFEERLWSIIRNFVTLGRENPAMLVNAIRIVELQESVDAKLESASNRIIEPKRYKYRAEQQIVMSVQDLFAPLLQACSQLAVAGENTDKRTTQILEQTRELQAQLADIYDYVTPCFPERYNIFNVIYKAYHEHMSFMLDCIGACSDCLANSDIVKVMGWVTGYQQTSRDLGIEEEDLQFPAGRGSGTWLMTEKYIDRVETTLVGWYINILEADLKSEPKSDDKGLLWTPGAVDFFRIVHEQMQVIQTVSTGNMLLRSGQASLRVMRQFQEAQHAYIAEGLSEEMLCAYVNNNMRCYNESTEFADRMEEALDEPFKGRLDIETQCRGFLDLAQFATKKLADMVFQEPALLEVFHKLYHTPEWMSGSVTATILATLNDYFHDYEKALDSSNFKRLVEQCLHEAVSRYLAAMITYIKTISEDLLTHMQTDNDTIIASFQDYMKPDKARKMVQALEDMRELAGSDNVDTFVISYNSLLQVSPGIFPLLVERIIVARPDLLKADIKEVMEQFKDVYLDRQKALGYSSPALPKAKQVSNIFKDKDQTYKLAFESALKKPEPITAVVLTKYGG